MVNAQATQVWNEKTYADKVYGGWLGKNIGGTLGAPLEGEMRLLDLTYYLSLPDGPLENDDLDLQLVWLHALEQYGPRLTSQELAQEWLEHVFFPFDEYGYALANMRKGIMPPLSGSYGNPFADCMGSPIRSEIWAMTAPGAPGVAAHYAHEDATVDHAGGEGVYGEMFFAALQSAAFVESNREKLLEIGLSYIPSECRTALAVRALIGWHAEGADWLEARARILRDYGSDNFTDAPQNIAFTVLGWLYGENFEDAILKAVNCGYDTDCTVATLGALLGILGGTAIFPARWVDPVGDRVVVSPAINGFRAPKDLRELTERTMAVAGQVAAYWRTGALFGSEDDRLKPDSLSNRDSATAAALPSATESLFTLPRGASAADSLTICVAYGPDGPCIAPRASKTLAVSLTNRTTADWHGQISLLGPEGWRLPASEPFALSPGATHRFEWTATAGGAPRAAYELSLAVVREHNGHLWREERIPLALAAAIPWRIAGPEGRTALSAGPGDRIDFRPAKGQAISGTYRAETIVTVPSARTIRLIAAADVPVRAYWDGKAVIDCAAALPLMPAYHRAPPEQAAQFEAEAGAYRLAIEADAADGGLPVVYALVVAPKEVVQPGPFFPYIDLIYSDTEV
ncbi:ADP-ribosylglycohydrolase family protein [Cohnella sp. GCM10020058]|uniref:ADP-ribosylglycohydrolase family protein n=1 Tax=Cohnella sp. GCM10020058 TaxID=3317330 RepID=UPI00363BFDEC